MIIIYTTNHCPYCDVAKQYFRDKNLDYEAKDIEFDESAFDELLEKLDGNFRGVPVFDINGQIIEGFDRSKIEKAL